MSRITNLFLIVPMILFPTLFIWQGVDITDHGYWTTNYNLIFTHPENVTGGFSCWLSVIIGGLWLHIFNFSGALAPNIGYLAVIFLTLFLVYRVVKDFFDIDQNVHILSRRATGGIV